jgi:hypothetical protein
MSQARSTIDERLRAIPGDFSPAARAELVRRLPRLLAAAADSLDLAGIRAEHDPEGALCHLVFVEDAISRAFLAGRRVERRRGVPRKAVRP